MIPLTLNGHGTAGLSVLCLGCHSDDIEIGCGGTILRLAAEYPASTFHWVVFSATGVRCVEAVRSAQSFTQGAQLGGPLIKNFPDGFLPFVGGEVKTVFEQLKTEIAPDLIFTHYRKDAHQDHRLVAEVTWSTFRNHLILEYEIPKYDGDMGSPNLYVPLSTEICETKVSNIVTQFQSQRERQWFERDTFFSLMRLRGMECNSPSGYAEGFYCRKVVL
jgi:LmbE family N-acetylglucosaminyl deacetylase